MNTDLTGLTYLIAALAIGLIVTSALGIYNGNNSNGRLTARNFAIASTALAGTLFVVLIWYYYNNQCYRKL